MAESAQALFVVGVLAACVAGWRQWRAGVLAEQEANDAVITECDEFIARVGERA